MQTKTERYLEGPSSGRCSEETARLLLEELRATRAESARRRRQLRAATLALAVLLVSAFWTLPRSFTAAEVPQISRANAQPLDPAERERRRAELIAKLPPEKRRELETFEREVDWLNGYMQTWDRDKAGAVVAIMLFRMAKSMDTMPSMEQQMRTMSAQMAALPAIVAELNQINAKMNVITGTMDSTMGRAGRMMPWMPFSP